MIDRGWAKSPSGSSSVVMRLRAVPWRWFVLSDGLAPCPFS